MHDHDGQWCEKVRLQSKQSVYPRQHRLVAHFVNVLKIIWEYFIFKEYELISRQRLDYESVIKGEEEEAATGTCPLACTEHLLLVALNIKRFDYAFLGQAVHFKDVVEQFLIATFNITLDGNP